MDQLGGLTDEDYLYPLVNYVARREAVGPLLDAFLSGDPARVRALHALTTGLVLTELRLDTPNASAESTPGFVAALREALDHAAALDLSVALYGARGEMAERSLEEIRSRDDVRLVAIIDRAMAGTRLAGVPVHGFFDLPALAPDLVLVAAAYSGPAIVEQLRPLEPRMSILPLYDLQASAWALFVA